MPSSDPKNYAIAFLACTTLAGAGLLIQTRQQLADARKAPSVQVTQSKFVTAAAPAPVQSPSAAPATEPAPVLASLAAPEERIETPPEAGANRAQRGAQIAAQMSALLQDPEFTEAWKIQQEARIEQRYGDLFRLLNLSPERTAELTALLVERENAGREVWASAAAQGVNPREARDELQQLSASLQAEVDATIESSFGAQTITALDVYNSTRAQRNAVSTLGQTFASSGQPLSSYQSQQLTRVITETGQPSGRNNIRITEATIAQAASFLSNDQLANLKKSYAVQRANDVVEQKTRAAREAAGIGGGGGGWRRDN